MNERSAKEREAARLERERRREERPGKLEPAPAAARSPRPAAAPPPAAREVYEPDPELDGAVGAGDVDGDHEIPAGTRRVPRSHRLSTAEKRAAPAQRRARTPARRPHKPHSRTGRIVSLVALVLAVVAIWFVYELFQPFHGSGHGSVRVTIPSHSSAGQIGDLLEHDGVISSSFFFSLRAALAGERGDLHAGSYHLRLGMSYGDVLKALTTPPKAAKVTELTLIEGRTRSQISALLHSQHVRGSYLVATRHSRLLNPRAYGASRSTPSLEGFLFPSTYQLRDPITINALVADQLTTFRKEYSSVNLSYARRKRLTPYEVLIIASMIQAEAQTEHDRPLIASVIYNRLRDGMPLQIDATTRYATGNYTRPLTVSQLNSPSPYNTRIHNGLPPTPIDNPGLASIQAAAHPSQTNYLYFVVKPCGNGEHAFASSYSQFLTYAARYQNARTQRGGRSPAHC